MSLALGVLASGSGTNFEAIARASREGRLDADLRLLVCNRPEAKVLERATRLEVPAVVVPHRDFASRAEFEAEVLRHLQGAGVEWVALAGFMRIVGRTLLQAFPDRILNIHPALLPSFPGLHAVRQALEAGVRESGCTIHLVDAGTDTGPRLAAASVPVHPDDDEETLQARIQAEERRLYPQVLAWIAEGRLAQTRGRWHLSGVRPPAPNIRIFDEASP